MYKTARKLLFATVILTLVATGMFVARGTGSDSAYNVPNMLGMGEGEGESTIQFNGPLTTDIEGPFVEVTDAPVSFDMDVRKLPQIGPVEKRPMREMGKMPMLDLPEADVKDPVLQAKIPGSISAAAPAPLMNFAGLNFAGWGAGWPPDTHGDVGPYHYIQAVNTSIGIFSKTTGARLAGFTFDSFFASNGGTGMCANNNNGDPFVLYDKVSRRWIITDFAWSNLMSGPYYECIAVSKTTNPVSGGWWLYTFKAHNTQLNDYPKLGVWRDGIYMSANMFDCLTVSCSSVSYSGVRVWALNRSDMISGAPLRSVSFGLGTAYFSLIPANLKGTLPPNGTPEYFLSDWGSYTNMKMWKFRVNWTTPASSTLTGPTTFAVAPYTVPSFTSVTQKGSVEKLDTLSDRLMAWVQYRNIGGTQSLWVSRTVKSGAGAGIRWYEIRGMSATPSVYQQGTYAPNTLFRWMPSLAVDKFGNMAVGYSVSNSQMYPAIRYAGRLVTDPLGILGQTERTLVAGTGSQSGGYSRWGDYSSMSVDPVDDCTFWYTSEYYLATGSNWQTRIGSFKFPGCP